MPREILIRRDTVPDVRSHGQAKRKKWRPARIVRIYRAWEIGGAQFRFLRSRISRDVRERVPDVRPRRRSPSPRGKTFDEPAGTTAGCRAGGQIYREQFSTFARPLALRSRLRLYTQRGCIGCVREPRGLLPTHAPGGLLPLNIYPSVRGESRWR